MLLANVTAECPLLCGLRQCQTPVRCLTAAVRRQVRDHFVEQVLRPAVRRGGLQRVLSEKDLDPLVRLDALLLSSLHNSSLQRLGATMSVVRCGRPLTPEVIACFRSSDEWTVVPNSRSIPSVYIPNETPQTGYSHFAKTRDIGR